MRECLPKETGMKFWQSTGAETMQNRATQRSPAGAGLAFLKQCGLGARMQELM